MEFGPCGGRALFSPIRRPPLGEEGWGVGMRRSGHCHFKRLTNCRDHEPHILVYLMIAETNFAVAARGKPCRPLGIMISVFRVQVLRAVEFDDQPLSKANEVDDVRAERGLSAKLVAFDLAGAQVEPEELLSGRWLVA